MSVINKSTFAYGSCIPDLPAHFHSGVSASDNTGCYSPLDSLILADTLESPIKILQPRVDLLLQHTLSTLYELQPNL